MIYKKIFVDGKLVSDLEYNSIEYLSCMTIEGDGYNVEKALESLRFLASPEQKDDSPFADFFENCYPTKDDYAAAAKWLEEHAHRITIDKVEIEDADHYIKYLDDMCRNLREHKIKWPVLKMAMADAYRARAEENYRVNSRRRASEMEKINWELPPYLETKEATIDFINGLDGGCFDVARAIVNDAEFESNMLLRWEQKGGEKWKRR